jgi:Leucine-rich repeat (LRR) protein
MICGYNQLTFLDHLPSNLVVLCCQKNQLTVLNQLPSNLQYLRCEHNQLTSFDSLPSSLERLNCSYNQIRSFENLPRTLRYVDFRENKKIVLPFIENTYNSHTMNEKQCPISLEDFTEGESIIQIKTCGHYFKINPIQIWYDKNQTCPLCRK